LAELAFGGRGWAVVYSSVAEVATTRHVVFREFEGTVLPVHVAMGVRPDIQERRLAFLTAACAAAVA
jgi:hypothetical protein